MTKIGNADYWLARHPEIRILDPDGWRGKGRRWDDEITEAEFLRRVMECTQLMRPPEEFMKKVRESIDRVLGPITP